jgi:outer membrane protein assembly factor BamB
LALIELDLTAQPGPAPTSIPPARRYRTAGLVLAVVLVLALGGAAAPDALRWSYLGTIPSSPIPESPFQLDGDRVYTASGLGNARAVSAWTVAKPPVRLWSVRFPARELGPDQVAYGDVRAKRAGDVVLITDGPDTTAVDPGTGATKWHLSIGVHPLPGGRVGLVQDPKFRAGTEYDQSGGAPGELYFSATGVPHDEPPVRTELRGVDLRTGATVWTAEPPGSVVAFDDPDGVLVLASDRLTLHAAATGAVLRETMLAPLDGQKPEAGRLVGDLVLVSYGADDSKTRNLVAYSTRTLKPVWQVPEARVLTDPALCLDVVCADDKNGASVLDPATGRVLWHTPGLDLMRYGDDVMEWDSAGSDPLRLADARNGDELLRLTGWHNDLAMSDDSPLMLRRTDSSQASVFAVVTGDPARLRPLGVTHGAVSACATDARFVICRSAGALQAFAYRG